MEYIIDKNFENVRLDKFLRKQCSEIALTEIFKAIRVGKIKVNGKKSKESYRLQLNDVVKVFFKVEKKQTEFIELSPNEYKLLKDGIRYEDEKVVIYEKPSGVVMHKGSGYEYGLSEMFKSYYQTDEFNFVNRIDRLTSGLVIGAKNLIVTRELADEIREGEVQKKYYILVEGVVKEERFQIKSYLKKIEDRVIELESFEEGAKESISYFKVIKRGRKRTILEAELGTGRTHQLRVQLSSLVYPIVGDVKYGKKDKKMFLYSYFCKIDRYNISMEMKLPEEFIEELS